MSTATSDAPAATGTTPPAATAAPSQTTSNPAPGTAAPAAPSVTWEAVKSQIPKEYSSEKMWESVKDIPTLLKNYVEAQKYVGGAVKIPKEGEGPEAWDRFYQKLGRPEAAEGYNFEMPELPGGLEWQDPLVNQFKKTAHVIGLTPKQAQVILNHYAEQVRGEAQGRREETARTLETLKQEVGPGYEKELAYGQAVLKQIGGQDVIDAINMSGIGNHVGFIKMMIRIGRELGEDSIIDVKSVRESEQSAQAKIDAIMADKKHPYWKPRDPGHARAVEEMSKLFGMVSPGSEEYAG